MQSGAGATVPITVGIDVEPDDRADPPGSGVRLDGFRATVAWLEGLRPLLADATGGPVALTWYVRMDPQIEWLTGRPGGLVEGIRPELETLMGRGDAVGLHTHAGRWDGSRWLADHGDPAWIRRCVETSARAYERLFGTVCGEHRFGDRWTGDALFDALVDVGIEVDATVEPGRRPTRRVDLTIASTGRIPGYLRAPREASSIRDGHLWLMPLTSADPGPGMSPLRRLARQLRYLGEPLHRPHFLDRGWSSPGACWEIAERRLAEMERPYLAFAIRSDITLGPRFGSTDLVLRSLLNRPSVKQLAFTSPRRVLASLGLLAGAPDPHVARAFPAPAAVPEPSNS